MKLIDFKFALNILGLCMAYQSFGCSCFEEVTLKKSFLSTDFVLKGKVIAIDTVDTYDMLVHDRKGIRVGKYKLKENRRKMIRLTIGVDKIFKGATNQADTIYILTDSFDECGYPFYSGMEYLFTAYTHVEKHILTYRTGRKIRRRIESVVLPNTLITHLCSYLSGWNKRISEELKNLQVKLQ